MLHFKSLVMRFKKEMRGRGEGASQLTRGGGWRVKIKEQEDVRTQKVGEMRTSSRMKKETERQVWKRKRAQKTERHNIHITLEPQQQHPALRL